MNTRLPCFVKNASNVYRTKTFIVRREISLGSDPDGMNVTFSRDTCICERLNGIESTKNTNCIDEGCIVGKVNEETINQMPKCN